MHPQDRRSRDDFANSVRLPTLLQTEFEEHFELDRRSTNWRNFL